MKFRNKKTGEVFPTITEAWTAFMCPGPCGDCNLQRGSTCEKEWIEAHPHEAARLMGYEVVEDEPEKTCDSCGYYKGSKVCGFKDFEIQITPEQGCAVWKPKEEANMDKPLKDWTLGELSDYCKKVVDPDGNCFNCEAKKYIGLCPFEETAPCDWDFEVKPRFTQQEVERAKAIKVIYPTAYQLEEADPLIRVWDKEGKLLAHVDVNLFLSFQSGQSYTLDEIIGGAE